MLTPTKYVQLKHNMRIKKQSFTLTKREKQIEKIVTNRHRQFLSQDFVSDFVNYFVFLLVLSETSLNSTFWVLRMYFKK